MISHAFPSCTCVLVCRYRTPQAFRAFTRVYLLFAGALYGPYFVNIGLSSSGSNHNLWLSLLFACVTQLIFSGLFRVMISLEDVFARRNIERYYSADLIEVAELVELFRQQLVQIECDSEAGSWDSPAHGHAPCERESTSRPTEKPPKATTLQPPC